MPTATIKFTSDFLTVALQRYRTQRLGRYVGLAIRLIIALAVLAPLAIWMFWQGQGLFGIFFGMMGVFMFFTHHVDNWFARRAFAKSPFCNEQVVIEFSDAGMHARSPKQETKLQWPAFTRVAYFKDGFLLFQGPKSFNWISLSSLGSPEQVAELATLLRANIPDHKIVEPGAVPNGGPTMPVGNLGASEGPSSVS
jgi:YcxB-like protein